MVNAQPDEAWGETQLMGGAFLGRHSGGLAGAVGFQQTWGEGTRDSFRGQGQATECGAGIWEGEGAEVGSQRERQSGQGPDA